MVERKSMTEEERFIGGSTSTVPPLQFGLQRWGVRLHLFSASSRGVLSFVLAFELLLRGRLQGWSGYCISPCEHQTDYRSQWRD
jgi:hypothetical protein